MDAPSLKRAASAVVIGFGGLLWLAAILFMAQTAQNSDQFSRLHPWILMINVAGLMVLVGLLATKLGQLVRDWRGHVIGSRLKARMVWIFGVLATLPILLVYFFAVQFLNRGIDSWFNVEIRQSLDDALVLSRSALEYAHARAAREHRGHCRRAFDGRRPAPGPLERLRRQAGALELIVSTESGAVIAVSKGPSSEVVPDEVPGEVLLQVRQGRPFVSLEPQAEGGYVVRTAVPLSGASSGRGIGWCCRRLPGRGAAGRAGGHRAGGLPAIRREGFPAQAAQGELHPDADRRAAAVAARGLVRGDLHGAAAGAADPGPGQGHPGRRARRPRPAPAAHLA